MNKTFVAIVVACVLTLATVNANEGESNSQTQLPIQSPFGIFGSLLPFNVVGASNGSQDNGAPNFLESIIQRIEAFILRNVSALSIQLDQIEGRLANRINQIEGQVTDAIKRLDNCANIPAQQSDQMFHNVLKGANPSSVANSVSGISISDLAR